jgi:iron complex transport system substrate-binding protein
VETAYNDAKELAKSSGEKPSVLAGSMYKDQWYVPYGNAWQAQFIKDANAEYIYTRTKGSGSMALSFETVLSEAQNTEYWVAPGQFKSIEHLRETSSHYNQFDAVKNRNVFTYSNTTGETGGVLYYELAPNRPDLVLKDLISIFHPELLPDYETTFFKPLK